MTEGKGSIAKALLSGIGKGIFKGLTGADLPEAAPVDNLFEGKEKDTAELTKPEAKADSAGKVENPNPSPPNTKYTSTPFPEINFPRNNVHAGLAVIAKESNRRINLVKKDAFDSIIRLATYTKNVNDAVVRINKRLNKVESVQAQLIDDMARLKQMSRQVSDAKKTAPFGIDTKEEKKEDGPQSSLFNPGFFGKLRPGLGATAKGLAVEGGRRAAAKGVFSGALKSGRVIGGAALGGLIEGGMEYYETGNAKKAATVGVGAGLGGWGGAAAGAAIGTLILPGIGTTAGAIIGGIAGSMGGAAISRSGYDLLTNPSEHNEQAVKAFEPNSIGPIGMGKNAGLLTDPNKKEPKRWGPIDMLFGKKKEADNTENTDEFKLKRTWINIEATTGDLELKAKRMMKLEAADRLYLTAPEIIINGKVLMGSDVQAASGTGSQSGGGTPQGPQSDASPSGNIPGTDIGRQGGVSGQGGLGLGVRAAAEGRAGAGFTGGTGAGGTGRGRGGSSGPSVSLNPENFKSIEEFRQKWGMGRDALLGTLKIESGLRTNITGGAGGNYHGIFQLQSQQIPGLTKAVFGREMTPQEYKSLSMVDQLKVMDMYYQKNGIKPGFFKGDDSDKARMWAMQLAPGNAKKINYDDPNAIISRSNQAGIIMGNDGVTVGSAIKGTTAAAEGVKLPEESNTVTKPGEYHPGAEQRKAPSESDGGSVSARRDPSESTHRIDQSGFIQPKDGRLYSSGNAQQCATLGKAFHPSVGRASGWNVDTDPNKIKPGMMVATGRYNDGSGGRQGAGYHTGVAITAPDSRGNFFILDQYSGRSAGVRMINAYGYRGIRGNDFGPVNGVTAQSMDAMNVALALAKQRGNKELAETIERSMASMDQRNTVQGVVPASETKTLAPNSRWREEMADQFKNEKAEPFNKDKLAGIKDPLNTQPAPPKSTWQKVKDWFMPVGEPPKAGPFDAAAAAGLIHNPDGAKAAPTRYGPIDIAQRMGILSNPDKPNLAPPSIGPIDVAQQAGLLHKPPEAPPKPAAPLPMMLQPRHDADTIVPKPAPKQGPYGALTGPKDDKHPVPTFAKTTPSVPGGPHRAKDWKSRAHHATSGRTNHHPEQAAPLPGDNGYGQKSNEDNIGLCSF